MKKTKKITNGLQMIRLMRSVLNSEPMPEMPPDTDWEGICSLAIDQNILPMIYSALQKYNGLPDSVMKKASAEYNLAMARDVIQDLEISGIKNAFEAAEIPCIFLKGSVLRDLYPRSVMRTMCDIDFLIPPEQTEKACEIMVSRGYEVLVYNQGIIQDVYHKKPLLHVEIHHELMAEKYGKQALWFKGIFSRSEPLNNYRYIRKMRDEDLYIHCILHMANHLKYAGTGTRSVADIRLLSQAKQASLDMNNIHRWLKTMQLDKFDSCITQLAGIWFGNDLMDENANEITEFLLSHHAYGSRSNIYINEVGSGENIGRSKFGIVFNLLFPRITTMQKLYPILHKIPVLLPFTWCARGLSIIFLKTRNIRLLSNILSINNETVQNRKTLFKKMGL